MSGILNVPKVKVSLFFYLMGLIWENGRSRLLLGKAAKKAFLADAHTRHAALLI